MRISNSYLEQQSAVSFENSLGTGKFKKPQKGDGEIAASLQISEESKKAFAEAIMPLEREKLCLPEYSGIYSADKGIAAALESCSKEEQSFVYDIIRKNFLLDNTSSLSEEERQANIALGMKKAQFASENFIAEGDKKSFLDSMEMIAKLASRGTADKDGNMDYGVPKANYLGHGKGLVAASSDTVELMKNMDSAAYQEYQRIDAESSNEERPLNLLKYSINWFLGFVKENPSAVDDYEKEAEKYVKKEVKNHQLKSYFEEINTSSKETFLDGLRDFLSKHQNFMSGIVSSEMANKFWGN